jgi:hypothetical protein
VWQPPITSVLFSLIRSSGYSSRRESASPRAVWRPCASSRWRENSSRRLVMRHELDSCHVSRSSINNKTAPHQTLLCKCSLFHCFGVRFQFASGDRQCLIAGDFLTIAIRAGLGAMAGRGSRSVTPESSRVCRGRLPQRRASGGGQLVVERVVEKIGSARQDRPIIQSS